MHLRIKYRILHLKCSELFKYLKYKYPRTSTSRLYSTRVNVQDYNRLFKISATTAMTCHNIRRTAAVTL